MTDFDQLSKKNDIPKSKTQIKREMEALQKIGKKLLELSKNQQEKIVMSERLRVTLTKARHIRQQEAMRRHLQYIGKIMRTEDYEAITKQVAMFDTLSAAHNKLFHRLKTKSDALIGENSKEVLTQYLEEHPKLKNIQRLRQLIRLSQKEVSQNGNTSNKKKLFHVIYEVEEKKFDLKNSKEKQRKNSVFLNDFTEK